MVTRRDALKAAAIGAPLLLTSHTVHLESGSDEQPPSPPAAPFARPVRIPKPPTKLNRTGADANPDHWKLAWEIYDQAIAPGSAKAPDECDCTNSAVKVWPRIIPEQDAEKFRPDADTDYYQLVIDELADVQILDGLKTTIWGYFDHPSADLTAPLLPSAEPEFPGPTLVAARNRPLIVRFVNRLPATGSRIAKAGESPYTAVHGHGIHTPPQSDGYPTDCIPPWVRGQAPGTRVYAHPNDNDFPATLWYHDHTNHHTGQNVYFGLAGFYILRPHPAAGGRDAFFRDIDAALPGGPYDVAMVIQDRLFHADGAMNYPGFNHDGVLGDRYLINGRVQPFMKVEPRRYRLRLLNGSNARFYEVGLSKQPASARSLLPFVHIGTEGALLPRPVLRRSTELAMAERDEIVVDFGEYAKTFTGSGPRYVYLVNMLRQDDGRGPDGRQLDGCTPLVRFEIGDTVTGGTDASCIPGILNPELVADANGEWAFPGYSVLDCEPGPTGALKERVFRFDRSHGMWTVNGEIFGAHRNDAVGGVKLCRSIALPENICMVKDPVAPTAAQTAAASSSCAALPTGTVIDEVTPARGVSKQDAPPEIWRFVNNSGGWAHPVHVHMEQFRLLSKEIDGQVRPVPPHEAGLKDTFALHENETVRVITTFKDPNRHFSYEPGVLQDYVFHCHNLEHEDMDMMATKRLVVDVLEPDPEACGGEGN